MERTVLCIHITSLLTVTFCIEYYINGIVKGLHSEITFKGAKTSKCQKVVLSVNFTLVKNVPAKQYVSITIVQSYTENITSSLPSVLLWVRSTSSNNTKSNKQVIFFRYNLLLWWWWFYCMNLQFHCTFRYTSDLYYLIWILAWLVVKKTAFFL